MEGWYIGALVCLLRQLANDVSRATWPFERLFHWPTEFWVRFPVHIFGVHLGMLRHPAHVGPTLRLYGGVSFG